jgi:hypothetical protein
MVSDQDEPEMTPVQEKAIAEVRKILKENFDSWLISYRITNENLQTKINHDWHGDIVDVVGLSSITQSRLLDYVALRSRREG